MKKYLLPVWLVIVAAFALAACAPLPEPGQTVSTPLPVGTPVSAPATTSTRTITVSGSGKITLAPDLAYVSIGVQTQSANVADALSTNNTKAQAIATAIQTLKIDPKDIQTSSFNIYPQQQFGTDGKVTSTTYTVDNTVNVTVRDLTVLGKLLDSAVRAGANSVNSINFDLVDRTKAVSDARKLAVADAHSQADELATAAGVTLGDLQSLNAVVNTGPVPLFDAKAAGAASTTSQVPVSAGQLTISVDVNAVYAIK